MKIGECEECVEIEADSAQWVCCQFAAAEAIEKIRAYEERKKAEEEIKVGDEVITPGGDKVAVTEINGKVIYGMSVLGSINACATDNAQKTGRHFPQIAELLEQMKE